MNQLLPQLKNIPLGHIACLCLIWGALGEPGMRGQHCSNTFPCLLKNCQHKVLLNRNCDTDILYAWLTEFVIMTHTYYNSSQSNHIKHVATTFFINIIEIIFVVRCEALFRLFLPRIFLCHFVALRYLTYVYDEHPTSEFEIKHQAQCRRYTIYNDVKDRVVGMLRPLIFNLSRRRLNGGRHHIWYIEKQFRERWHLDFCETYQLTSLIHWYTGPLFIKKTPSYQYRDSHYKPETVVRPS